MYQIGTRAMPLTPQDKVEVNPNDRMRYGKIYETTFKAERSLNPDEEKQVVNAIAAQKYFEGVNITYAGANGDDVVVQCMAPQQVSAFVLPVWVTWEVVTLIIFISAVMAFVVSFTMILLTLKTSSVLENVNPATLNIAVLGLGVALLVGGVAVLMKIFAPEVEWLRGTGYRRREGKRRKEEEKRREKEKWREGYAF